MTNEPDELDTGNPGVDAHGKPPIAKGGKQTLLPGMIGIALYMLVLAATVSFGVVGGFYSRLFLILVPLFITASFGLLKLFRWAWALALSAVFLLMTYEVWLFLIKKEPGGAVMGLLNMVMFLYLVRVDVRTRLR